MPLHYPGNTFAPRDAPSELVSVERMPLHYPGNTYAPRDAPSELVSVERMPLHYSLGIAPKSYSPNVPTK